MAEFNTKVNTQIWEYLANEFTKFYDIKPRGLQTDYEEGMEAEKYSIAQRGEADTYGNMVNQEKKRRARELESFKTIYNEAFNAGNLTDYITIMVQICDRVKKFDDFKIQVCEYLDVQQSFLTGIQKETAKKYYIMGLQWLTTDVETFC